MTPGPRPLRGLDARTRTWWRGLARREGWRHTTFIDGLMRRGRRSATDWPSAIDDISFLGCDVLASGLSGLLGKITSAGSPVTGTVVHTPGQGVIRSQADDAVADTYITLGGTKPSDLGWTDSAGGFFIYVTTDYRYIFRELGRSSSGLLALNMCTGLAGFLTLGGDSGKRFISTSATGLLVCGRKDADDSFAIRDDQAAQILSDPFVAWPTATLDLLSAEPTGANSPNGVALVGFHHFTLEQADEARWAILQYAADAGFLTAPSIRNPTPNCLADSDLADVVPNDLRIYVSAGYPPSNGAPPSAYPYYPLTDTVNGGHNISTRVVTLATDALTTVNGSNLVTVSDPGFNGRVGDLAVVLGATGGNGLTDADVSGRREVVTVTQVDAVTRTWQFVAGASANADGAIGGSDCQVTYTMRVPLSIAYTPSRNGGMWFLMWDNRGKTPPDHPQASRVDGGGNGYGGGFSITRLTASDDGRLKAGANCRPGFTNWAKAVTVTEAQVWKALGGLDRNDARHPQGYGVLDILDQGGSTTVDGDGVIGAENAMTIGAAWMRADELFTDLASGYATAWDICIWYPVTLADITGLRPKGVMFDFEPNHFMPPDLQLVHMQRLADMHGATNYKAGFHPNIILEGQMLSNGFTTDTLNAIVNHDDVEFFGIITQKGVTSHPDVGELVDYQVAKFAGPLPVPAKVLGLTVISATGPKFTIDDDNPLGPTQLSILECEKVAAAVARHDEIGAVWVGFRAGGDANQFVNHQLEALLPNLSPGSPAASDDPTTQVDLWISAKVGLGGATPSDAVRSALINYLIGPLVDSGWWDRLTNLTWAADDLYGHRVDLRQLFTGAFNGTSGTPTLTPFVCATYDGVDDSLASFVPATNPGNMTPTNLGLFFYETINTASSGQALGMGLSSNGNAFIRPRTTTNNAQVILVSSGNIGITGVTDSRGLWAVQRSGNIVDVYRNGEAFSLGHDVSSFSTPAGLSNRPFRIGSGTAGLGPDMPTQNRNCAPSLAGAFAPTGASTGLASANDHRTLKTIFDGFLAAVAP